MRWDQEEMRFHSMSHQVKEWHWKVIIHFSVSPYSIIYTGSTYDDDKAEYILCLYPRWWCQGITWDNLTLNSLSVGGAEDSTCCDVTSSYALDLTAGLRTQWDQQLECKNVPTVISRWYYQWGMYTLPSTVNLVPPHCLSLRSSGSSWRIVTACSLILNSRV